MGDGSPVSSAVLDFAKARVLEVHAALEGVRREVETAYQTANRPQESLSNFLYEGPFLDRIVDATIGKANSMTNGVEGVLKNLEDTEAAARDVGIYGDGARGSELLGVLRWWKSIFEKLRSDSQAVCAKIESGGDGSTLRGLLMLPGELSDSQVMRDVQKCRMLLSWGSDESNSRFEKAKNVLENAAMTFESVLKEAEEKRKQKEKQDEEDKKEAQRIIANRESVSLKAISWVLELYAIFEKKIEGTRVIIPDPRYPFGLLERKFIIFSFC
eukprot:Trichotokara_eunicae@DN4459_c0_g1_i1.p1